ncbi:tyrosine-type recombinase/integrase [Priestia aryabhattai]|uniref:tyrosine-type recombinase/integrase n=1 Tax=Priestia aryabhattai TaxID=412384 RepID=UPI0039A01B2B
MAKLNNVVQLNSGENKNPYATIYTFLTSKGHESDNTRKTYERAIRDFFRTMKNKEIEHLIETDLTFTKDQIKKYSVALKNNGYADSTVNNALTAIRECYRDLKDDGFDVDVDWFMIKRYSEKDKKRFDSLSHEEIIEIIQLVSKTRKGSEKALLVRLAYATAFRKESLLNLTWNDIYDDGGIRYVKTIGKGKEPDYKKLSDDLYDTLMAHKATTKGDKIFELTDKTVNRMMNYIREHMYFGNRRIVFHSFKKASINEVAVITNYDIKAMQRQGNHKDVKTTLNEYAESKRFDDLVIVDINYEIPTQEFDELTHEELLALVKSMDRNTHLKMLQKLKGMK